MPIIAFEENNQGHVTGVQFENGKWFPMPEGLNVNQAEAKALPMRRENGVLIVGGTVKRKKVSPPAVQEPPPAVFEGTIDES